MTTQDNTVTATRLERGLAIDCLWEGLNDIHLALELAEEYATAEPEKYRLDAVVEVIKRFAIDDPDNE